MWGSFLVSVGICGYQDGGSLLGRQLSSQYLSIVDYFPHFATGCLMLSIALRPH